VEVSVGVNWHSFFFLLFALVACAFSVAVVVTSNIVRMAFYLVLALGATAGLFFLAGAEFVGAMQLMIYVGGTMVLLVFGVMLTAQGPFISMKTSAGDWVAAVVIAGLLVPLLIGAAFSVGDWRDPTAGGETPVPRFTEAYRQAATAPLGLGLEGPRVDKLWPERENLKPGMSGYLLPFEIVSVHLLVVLVGAAYLARTKRRRKPV